MAARILIVDDEPQFERLLLQRLRKKIREGKYNLSFAQNGQQALEVLEQEEDFDMVLSDINMPKMDGLTFLSRLRETRPRLRTVMVSAYGDMSNIRAAMNLGAFDFVTKPINFEDLETTIEKTLKEVEVTRKAEMAEELELMNEKLKEIDQFKSRFFTNISHEFRTPLTIITGMADQIRESPEKWFSDGLKMIKRNGNNLLNLVNQILDLAKLESGKLKLQYIQSDLIGYLKYVAESFLALAEKRSVQLEFEHEMDELIMDYDPERFLRVVSNLLSNAIKFTPAGGKVLLKASSVPEGLQVSVSDTGVGIPEDRLPYIFDRFYQVDPDSNQGSMREEEGTGIGLALVKELVHLMDGKMEVDSQPGEGTTFRLTFPVRRSAELPASTGRPATHTEDLMAHTAEYEMNNGEVKTGLAPQTGNNGQPSLLIVEDNPDIVQYLRSCLESEYELMVGRNGQEGIDLAIEEVPDLIVSDVMMPLKNGSELCQTLKTDERTSHIPIILLTAKSDQESRVEGLTRGADAYLSKPFDKQELLVRLNRLLELRRNLQQRYQQLDGLTPTEDQAVRQEDAFLMKVRDKVEENLDNENLSIAGLARSIGVSRAQLHNKVSALTGHSPSVFVRTIRLYKAKELLKVSDLNISQVAYEVGFRDPAYFTRTFSNEFGQSPKEMRK